MSSTSPNQLPTSTLSPEAKEQYAIRRARVKARNTPCDVKEAPAGSRIYRVTTPLGHSYKVKFEKVGISRFGRCNCVAGTMSIPCYHLIKAAELDDQLCPRAIA